MIGEYRFGTLEIDGETYDHDLIYHQGRVSSWWRKEGHNVGAADIEPLLKMKPEIVVIGTGAFGAMQVAADARSRLAQAGIKLFAEESARAVQRYNAFMIEGRNVALAIHLTC